MTDYLNQDIWMHLIIQNDHYTLKFLIDYYQEQGNIPLDTALKNTEGKSHFHLAVMPNKFGWIGTNLKVL